MSLNSGPSLAPSKPVEPIATSSRAVVPVTAASRVAEMAGGRSTSRPSGRRPTGASSASSPNHTPNASPRRVHGSTPYRLIPTSWIATYTSISTASGAGSVAAAQVSSQMVKARIPAAAGQWPSRSGYGKGSGSPSPATRAATQPVRRPTARHGLSSRNTSPNSSVANGTPIQTADVHRPRREVVHLVARSREAGVDRDREGADADGTEQHLDGERDAQERQLRHTLEPRARPACRERQERQHEHDRRADDEQLDRDREIGPPTIPCAKTVTGGRV